MMINGGGALKVRRKLMKAALVLAAVALPSIGLVDQQNWCAGGTGDTNCPTSVCTTWNAYLGSVSCCCDPFNGYCDNYLMEKWSCGSPANSFGYKNRVFVHRLPAESCGPDPGPCN